MELAKLWSILAQLVDFSRSLSPLFSLLSVSLFPICLSPMFSTLSSLLSVFLLSLSLSSTSIPSHSLSLLSPTFFNLLLLYVLSSFSLSLSLSYTHSHTLSLPLSTSLPNSEWFLHSKVGSSWEKCCRSFFKRKNQTRGGSAVGLITHWVWLHKYFCRFLVMLNRTLSFTVTLQEEDLVLVSYVLKLVGLKLSDGPFVHLYPNSWLSFSRALIAMSRKKEFSKFSKPNFFFGKLLASLCANQFGCWTLLWTRSLSRVFILSSSSSPPPPSTCLSWTTATTRDPPLQKPLGKKLLNSKTSFNQFGHTLKHSPSTESR